MNRKQTLEQARRILVKSIGVHGLASIESIMTQMELPDGVTEADVVNPMLEDGLILVYGYEPPRTHKRLKQVTMYGMASDPAVNPWLLTPNPAKAMRRFLEVNQAVYG